MKNPLSIIAASLLLATPSFAYTIGDDLAAPLVVASVGKAARDAMPAEQPTSYGMARDDRPPEELRLNLDGRDIVVIFATGDVQLGDGLTVDEASRAFWKRVGELAPNFCRGRSSQQASRPEN